MNQKLEVLYERKQWLVWQYVQTAPDTKPKKIPCSYLTGKPASVTDEANLGTFSQVRDFINTQPKPENWGIGIAMGHGLAGIDLDNCIMPNQVLADTARDIVLRFNSYTEFSPSGKGMHILFTHSLTDAECKELLGGKLGARTKDFELYLGQHYLTVTGSQFGVENVSDCTEALKKLCADYLPKQAQSKQAQMNFQANSFDTIDSLPDSEFLRIIFNSEYGHKIKALFDGDISGYPSHSEADLALCRSFAFFTRGDYSRIDRLFRQSSLMRDKWIDRDDYRDATISRAIETTAIPDTFGADCFNAYTQFGGMGCLVNSGTNPNAEFCRQNNMLTYLQNSFHGDIERFTSCLDIQTGFTNLDADLKLYNGLYVFGGVSGLGKTSLALQIADNIAQQGHNVLYISFEQSRLEFASKTLSRLTALNNFSAINDYLTARKKADTAKKHAEKYYSSEALFKANDAESMALELKRKIFALSAIEIRRGINTDALQQAVRQYSEFAQFLTIAECPFGTTASDLLSTIKSYVDTAGSKPVVVIDYLQVVAPDDIKQPATQATDCHIQALKKLSLELQIPVILLSSFNRENYLSIVDFTSFKQSGGIEYSADVVLGLQLACMNSTLFDGAAKLSQKRLFARRCMSQSPRLVEAVVLKNRFGRMGLRFFFEYYPAYDLFVPPTLTESEIEARIRADFKVFENEFADKSENNSDSEETIGKQRKRNTSNDKGEW